MAYLAEGVEDVVEIDQDLALGDLGYVVHGLAGIVPDAGILVSEAGEHRRHDELKVPRKLLFATREKQGQSVSGEADSSSCQGPSVCGRGKQKGEVRTAGKG